MPIKPIIELNKENHVPFMCLGVMMDEFCESPRVVESQTVEDHYPSYFSGITRNIRGPDRRVTTSPLATNTLAEKYINPEDLLEFK